MDSQRIEFRRNLLTLFQRLTTLLSACHTRARAGLRWLLDRGRAVAPGVYRSGHTWLPGWSTTVRAWVGPRLRALWSAVPPRNGASEFREPLGAWGIPALIVAVAAIGLVASNEGYRAQLELSAQQKATFAARQLADWIAQQKAALSGLTSVGRGIAVMANAEQLARTMPNVDTVVWWDRYAKDGRAVIAGPLDATDHLLAQLARVPVEPQAGVQVSLVLLPDGGSALLFVAAEAYTETPWQIVLGALFDLNTALDAALHDVLPASDTAIRVRDARNRVLYADAAFPAEGGVAYASLKLNSDDFWLVDVAPQPTLGMRLRAFLDDGLFWLVAGIGFMYGLNGARLARQRHSTILALRRLAEAGDRHRRVLEASSDAVLIMDAGGRIQWCNRAAERMFGLASDGLIGRVWDQFLPAEIGASHWDGLSTGPWPPGSFLPGEVHSWEAHRADGSTFAAEVLVTATGGHMPDDPREITAFVRDVTERAQLEERMRRAERFEALGRLAGGVAHDFNNILAALIARVQLLQSPRLPQEQRAKSFTSLNQALDAAKDLVQQLLLVGRSRPAPPRPVDLNACIVRHVTLLRGAQCQNRHVVLELEATLPDVMADESQLGQVVLNLCVNAAQATQDGDTILVRTQTGWDGRTVVLEVSDTGHGIAPEHLPHLFEPFYTTKQERGGSGLGLATVYSIVRGHGGEVQVESEQDRGTTFFVRLPAAGAQVPAPLGDGRAVARS